MAIKTYRVAQSVYKQKDARRAGNRKYRVDVAEFMATSAENLRQIRVRAALERGLFTRYIEIEPVVRETA